MRPATLRLLPIFSGRETDERAIGERRGAASLSSEWERESGGAVRLPALVEPGGGVCAGGRQSKSTGTGTGQDRREAERDRNNGKRTGTISPWLGTI